ncbi:shikimate kinase [Gemmatimonas sp.]|uniref:shikimate kinase n=1 Tax=Gemmatimonas sp. TaxID=1962908 RepID=UPI00356A8AAA
MTRPTGLQIDGHLVLVGLPGSGKSTVGRAVAKRLSRPFLDFDTEIEKREGISVARIFAEKGEVAFRAMELSLTQELAAAPPMVLAPGGGWVTIPGAMVLLRPPGRIIYLQISPKEALRRLTRSRIVRPLLAQADPAMAMHTLWERRSGLYAQADVIVHVESVDSQRLIDSVVALAHDGTPRIG